MEQLLHGVRVFPDIRHPNIASMHEVGWHDGWRYYVSDFVEGLPLDDWRTGQRPTILESVELCVKLADVLEYVHVAGYIYRDLRPSNIMIDVSGEPHLMDLGLNRPDAWEVVLTDDGHVLRTPAYMSPEQA